MYGWDSFFIQMGLLRDGQIELAKDMADDALYEVREYGKVLNANRTYYLTRSQPPFLTEMVLAVYDRTKDRAWLEQALPAIETYYRYWTTEPHLTPETGLSRYYDLGAGPSPEVLSSEHDSSGRNDYDLIKEYFRSHRTSDYDAAQYYDAAKDELTPLFYKGDRSMRESGFDPSGRFGPFSVDIIHYDPVCLNTLLYLMEVQIAGIMSTLSRDNEPGRKGEEAVWPQRAERRAARINQLMWDQSDGFYFITTLSTRAYAATRFSQPFILYGPESQARIRPLASCAICTCSNSRAGSKPARVEPATSGMLRSGGLLCSGSQWRGAVPGWYAGRSPGEPRHVAGDARRNGLRYWLEGLCQPIRRGWRCAAMVAPAPLLIVVLHRRSSGYPPPPAAQQPKGHWPCSCNGFRSRHGRPKWCLLPGIA